MDWLELFNMQQKLDNYIQENHQLKSEELFDRKILALLVEVGELANETKCFKFWSTKPASPQSVILEEYVDGLHFILSIGLDKQYDHLPSKWVEKTKDLTNLFNIVFEKIIAFKHDQSKESYKELIYTYIGLGNALGFSEDNVKDAYYEKNKVNFERQDSGY
ncbi:dUTP diphosphatase [Aquibacillus kalidii]|uniref:dUTP diphosphatase n=1 Tax=Aquibacillus kalidii TaxID=2762597 RepID=UPI001646E49F|nr:dUTP diphosphatase [Aquibacillus kalidii]